MLKPPPPATQTAATCGEHYTLRRRLWLTLTATVIYAAIALWCIRSVLPRWHGAYVGSGELEGWLWRYWWMKRLLVDAWHHASATYTAYVAMICGSYPETGNVFDLQFLSMPLDALFGDPAYYNVKVVVVLVLDALAGYWLGRLLVRDWSASLLCGFVFAFGAYVLLEIDTGRIRQALVFPLALHAFALTRMTFDTRRLRYPVYGGLSLGLCSAVFLFYGLSALFLTVVWMLWLACPPRAGSAQLADVAPPRQRAALHDYALYLVVLAAVGFGIAACAVAGVAVAPLFGFTCVVILLCGAWLAWRDGWPRVRQLTVFLLVSVITSLPYATSYIQQALRHQALPEVTYGRDFPDLATLLNPQINVHSSDDPLLNSLQRFRGDSVSWNFPFLSGYRRAVPVVLTALAVGGLFFFRRRPWLWICTLLLGYVLSLGPYLRAGAAEQYVTNIGPWTFRDGVRLPQAYFFKYVPFFSRLFSPIRMEGLFLLGFAAIVAWSAATMFTRVRATAPIRILFAATVIALALWQMDRTHQIPLNYTPLQVPDVYSWIARSNAQGVVEIPLREGDFVNYYQIFHGKRVLDGWACGSLPADFPDSGTRWLAQLPFDVTMDNSFLKFLRAANDGESSTVKSFSQSDLAVLPALGYRWALLHERGCYIVKGNAGHMHYLWMRRLLDGLFGAPVRVSHERLREYWTEGLAPDTDGLYTYEIAVYDLRKLSRAYR